MKKYVVMILIAIVLIIGGGTFAYFHFANGGPWQGTWWGVQDAGVNWSGDHIRNLETVTFTQNDDKTITVDHKVQQGSREVPGSLTGTGRIDGGRLVITPKNGGKELALSYSAVSRSIDTPFTNADKRRTLAALLKVQQMGVRIVLASGRPTYGLMPLAKMLELGNYGGFILSYNGCQIINAQNGEILFERRINPEMLPYLEKKARKNGFALFTYHDDTIITDSPENEHIQNEARLNDLQIIKEEEFSAAVDFAPCKCMLVSDDEEALLGLEDHWKRRLNGALDVFRSEPYFLEVVPCAIDKANSLGALLEVLDVKREEVIAVGDGVCDVTMIQLAGLGIAMGHSQDSVKACADYVTASNEEDGVAVAVEKAIIAEVRAAEIPLDQLNAQARHALMGNLGIQYTYADEDRVEATMPVDHRTRQPFGILHGGATLALAETVAGLGSMILCQPDEIVVGMQVSGNHISSAHEGDTVRAVGTVVHKGRSSHVWNVDVFTSTNKLVSSIRVVNSVMKKR